MSRALMVSIYTTECLDIIQRKRKTNVESIIQLLVIHYSKRKSRERFAEKFSKSFFAAIEQQDSEQELILMVDNPPLN